MTQSQIEKTLANTTRTADRQQLLKQLWKLQQSA